MWDTSQALARSHIVATGEWGPGMKFVSASKFRQGDSRMLSPKQFPNYGSVDASVQRGYRPDAASSDESRLHNEQLSALHMALNDPDKKPIDFGPPTGPPQRQPLGTPGPGTWERTEQGAWKRAAKRGMSKPTKGPRGTFYE